MENSASAPTADRLRILIPSQSPDTPMGASLYRLAPAEFENADTDMNTG